MLIQISHRNNESVGNHLTGRNCRGRKDTTSYDQHRDSEKTNLCPDTGQIKIDYAPLISRVECGHQSENQSSVSCHHSVKNWMIECA